MNIWPKRRVPPGPRREVIGLRHIPRLKRNFLEYGLELKAEYGDAVRFCIGPISIHVFSHPDHFREALVDHPENLGKPKVICRAMRPLLRGAIGISEGAAWAHRRKLVNTALAHLDLDEAAAATVRHVRRSVLPHAGGELALTDALERVLASASFETTVGPGFEENIDEVYDLTCSALAALAGQINGWIPLWMPTPRRRRITRAAARFAELTEAARQRCLMRNAAPESCLVAGLMAAEGDGRHGTPTEIGEEAAMMFVGGKETAGPAATWMAYLLARHPDVQTRAIEEVDRVVGQREVNAADAVHLRYLDAVYKETLRLYPPAFMIIREALKATRIAGYDIPQRSVVCLFNYASQRDPRWFHDPDEFRPERFLESSQHESCHAFVPFGIGKRGCPGGRLATLQSVVAMATILQRHCLVWPAGRADAVPSIHMGLRPPLGLSVRLEARVDSGAAARQAALTMPT